jgi:hypothetical protein
MQVTGTTTLRRALPFCVAAIALIAGLLVAHPYAVGVFHDDGAYAILAKSIAEGRGLHFLQLPGEPVAIHYPPAYPLLLSVIWWMAPQFPANVPALLALNALCLGAVAYGVYRLCVGTFGWSITQAAAASLVATLSYPLLLLSGILLSEPLFIAALVLLLPTAERMRASALRPSWWFLPFGLACGGLAMIRTHGLALPAAMLLLLVGQRRWRDASWCVAGLAIAMLPWQVWQAMYAGDLPAALAGSYGSYVAWFAAGFSADGFLIRTLSTNAREIWSLLAGRFSPADGAPWSWIAPASALAAFVYGGWRAHRAAPALVWSTIIYLGIVMLWPYSPWRFLFALWPILIVLLGEAMRGVIAAARQRRPEGIAAAALMALLAVGMGIREARAAREGAWWTPATVAAQQTVPGMVWIVRNTAPRDVIASEVPELVHLYTGRYSVPVMPFNSAEYGVPRSPQLDGANVGKTVRELPVTHIVTISPWLRDAVRGAGVPAVLLDSTKTYAAFRITR